MKYASTLGLIVLAMTIASDAAASPAAPHQRAIVERAHMALSKSDEAAIRAVIAAFADSWTRHDMRAMHGIVTPDVEWVNVVGNDWHGIEEVRKGHANFHHFLAARSTSSVESVAVRRIATDTAIAVTVFHFEGQAPDGKPEDTRTRSSMVMSKRGGEWKIIHQHNTIINPATQGAADPMNFDEKTGLPRAAQ